MNLKFLRLLILLIFIFVLSGCKSNEKVKHSQKVVVAELKSPVDKLYFSGSLLPIKVTPVVAPVESNIEAIDFVYGQKILEDNKLFTLSSQSLADQYRTSVSGYLQKKQAYTVAKLSFSGTEALYKAGVISQSQYSTEKTQYDNSELDYMQAKFQLEKVLRTANLDANQIEKLSISDTDKVNAILQKHFNNIVIKAPVSGIALYPSGDGDDSKPLTVGEKVKDSQLLLLIGDLSGLSAKFKVSEIDIDRIKKNMQVTVTSNAFPNFTLKGFVSSVSAQATNNSDGGGLSMFSVAVSIPELSDLEVEKIRVGMTAKFEIDIPDKKEVMLPIGAVFQKNGKAMVTIINGDAKKDVEIATGTTTLTDVVVLSGVKAGDKVLMHD